MQLITELKYNTNDFNNIEIGDLIVVFEGNITVIHIANFNEIELDKIEKLLKNLCNKFHNLYYEIFDNIGNIKNIFTKNNYQNISYALLQFAGYPNLLIGEVDEDDYGFSLIIDNTWYDVLNSKELYQLIKTNLLYKNFTCVSINDQKYRLEDIAYFEPEDIPLANPLYHGTIEKYLPNILTKGIRKIQDNSIFNATNEGFVFLTSDYNTAKEYAGMYSKRFKSKGVVIQVNTNHIDKNKIVLDYDFVYSFGQMTDKSPYTGNEIGYNKHYKGSTVSVNKNYGTKYGKIGYKGIIMPNAIERLFLIYPNGYEEEMNKEKYLNNMKQNNIVENKLNEWYYPDNFQELPDKITLYHGTDYFSLEEILSSGIIDAYNGRSTGETKGMNWFSTKYSTNFSRGFVFSIEINKNEIGRSNDGFRYMNNSEIANYEPIDIHNRNIKICEAFNYEYQDLVRMWNIQLKKTNNNIEESFYNFVSFFQKYCEHDVFIDDAIIIQLMKQLIGENGVKHLGLTENKIINEVNSNDINLKSFKPKSELHPKIWVDDKLNSRIRLRLLDIADDFIDTLAVDWVKPEDVVFTGSLANYNWSRYSDIDVHIIIDYNKVYKKKEFVEDYFNAKKENWLNEHPHLKIYGFPVEMYVEDLNSENISSGVYSLYKNKWIKEPINFQDAKLNEKYIKNYASRIMTQIDNIENKQKNENDEHKVEKLQKNLKEIFDKLKKLRKESLSKQGEMGSGNIIYKILRRSKYIDKIWDLINTSYDKINSIQESKIKG